MVRRGLSVLCLGLTAIFMSSCGQTYTLQSISISAIPAGTTTPEVGTVGLNGMGDTENIIVTANYSNTKSDIVTTHATLNIIPVGLDSKGNVLPPASTLPNSDLEYDASGLLTAVDPGVCTWANDGTQQSPSDAMTGYYKITATYQNLTSEPIYVPLATAAPCANPGSAYQTPPSPS